MELNNIPVDDTFCEAFDGLVLRMIVTAENEKLLKKAAYGSTALPSTVVGRTEGGVERFLKPSETPDGRPGAVIQIWGGAWGKNAKTDLEYDASIRIRQGILVVPSTRLFNALEGTESWDTLERVGYCGDGFETEVESFGRRMINVPLMMGEFLIEREMTVSKGIMGGNVWFFCESEKAGIDAGTAALESMQEIDNVIDSFGICSAGSKVGSIMADKGGELSEKYKEIGPTTNHRFCPGLKGRIDDSLVPDGVKSIPEIVINGITLDDVKAAMKACMEAASKVDGLVRISAGNFGGELGKHKIYLKELL